MHVLSVANWDVALPHPSKTRWGWHACRGDAVEATFQASLVEDRSSAGTSYVDYLVQIHRLIIERSR